MRIIRKILSTLFNIKTNVRILSRIYLFMVSNGMLKKQYPELFFLKKIVRKDDICIDIGANVGYYSSFLSKITGENGKVHAVEPIPIFGDIWKKNVKYKKRNNLKLYPYALGGEEKTVKMGIPEVDGLLHHGMTKIVSTRDDNYLEFYDVEMKIPDKLFYELDKLDFIKCDVEGYEYMVFSNFLNVLKKHKPLVQSELSGKENREKVVKLFTDMGYTTHILYDNKLKEVDTKNLTKYKQDFYFIQK